MTHADEVKAGTVDIERYALDTLKRCESLEDHGYFTVLCDPKDVLHQVREIKERVERKTAGPLAGIIITVKDNICVKGVESTATSRILRGYKPFFDAEAVARLKARDAIIIGKTSCDEFGFGSFNTNVGLGYRIPIHPLDPARVTGGSSGGAAGATAKLDVAHVALAESTGGSIENPAAFCGVIGFCPTYGAVSRHGLISYANSLDKIGLMAKRVEDIIPAFEAIAGHDPKDGTSLRDPLPREHRELQGLRAGWLVLDGVDDPVARAMAQERKRLESLGVIIEDIELPLTMQAGIAAYYIIAACEASTNLACLTGLRYGQEAIPNGKSFSEYFTQVRSEHFGPEAKRRIILGTFARMAGYRDAYYLKAAKVRTRIITEYKEAFKRFDIIISPTMPVLAPKAEDVKRMTPVQQYLMDALTVGPNLAGLPHASVPIGSEELPVGMMLIADHRQDYLLLDLLTQVDARGTR